MKLLVEKLPDLRSLYLHELRVLLYGEKQLATGLQRMIENSSDRELGKAFEASAAKPKPA